MNQKIIKSKIAPHDRNVLWLDSNSNTLKLYDNGWQPLYGDYIKNIIQKNTGIDNTIIDFVDEDLKSIIENNEYVTARALNDLNKRIGESIEYIGTPIYILKYYQNQMRLNIGNVLLQVLNILTILLKLVLKLRQRLLLLYGRYINQKIMIIYLVYSH